MDPEAMPAQSGLCGPAAARLVAWRRSWSEQALRVCWALVWGLIGRPSPRPLHAWRRLLLRAFGARIGAGVHVYPGARIWAPWRLTMAAGSCLADGVDCYNMAQVRIGARATVSQRAFLCTGTHDDRDPGFPLLVAPIVIGDEAWICAQSIVGPGVQVGDGAVVGAGAVAMRDVAPWTVVAGNPCRVIRQRCLRHPATA